MRSFQLVESVAASDATSSSRRERHRQGADRQGIHYNSNRVKGPFIKINARQFRRI